MYRAELKIYREYVQRHQHEVGYVEAMGASHWMKYNHTKEAHAAFETARAVNPQIYDIDFLNKLDWRLV